MNVILRGIPEGRCRYTNQQNDDNTIYEVLEALGCQNAYDDMISFNRLGKRLGKRLLMVTFNNERAVKCLLNRAPLLNRVRHVKHIYIMKDRPRSERPVTNEPNRLAEAAAGAINANSETSTEGRGVILNGGMTAPASTPNSRTMSAGDVQQSSSVRSYGTRILEGIRSTRVSLFGESPSRERRQETLAPGSAEQGNAQSGNGGVESQDPMG